MLCGLLFGPLVVFALTLQESPAQGCTYPGNAELTAGRDGDGYFVTAATVSRRDADGRYHVSPLQVPGLARLSDTTGVMEYLAAEARAVVLYVGDGRYTARAISEPSLRASDPKKLAQAFTEAAGLELLEPQPGWWVLSLPGEYRPPSISAWWRTTDSGQSAVSPAESIRGIERELLRQLPVRHLSPCERAVSTGLLPYWLTEDGEGMLLVQSVRTMCGSGTLPEMRVFKARVDGVGESTTVHCLWSSNVPGPLVPGLAEDFDGDGVRDFVFAAAPDYDHTPNAIISGRTGALLQAFAGRLIVVGESSGGGKPIAVWPWPPDRRWGRAPSSKELEQEWNEGGPRTVVLKYSGQTGKYEETAERETTLGPEGASVAEVGQEGPRSWRHAIDRMGGATKVRLYRLMAGQEPLDEQLAGVPEVACRSVPWTETVTAAMIAKGYPAHILFEHSFSPPPTAVAPLPQSP